MQLVRQKLYKEFSNILNEEDLNFIETKTKEILKKDQTEDAKSYIKIFNRTVAKFVLGKFANTNSQNYLNNYLKKIFDKQRHNFNCILELTSLFNQIKVFPTVDITLKLINENEQLYNCLNNIYESNKNIILSAKIDNILDDEIFHQFMEVFLDQKGITINENYDFEYFDNVKDIDSTKMFLREMNSFPLLSKEQELELFQKLAKGDETASKKLVEHNLRLIAKIAKRYANEKISFMDLVQEGSIGLIKAIEKFDYKKGYKFSTYATWWIRQTITRALMDKGLTIRLPVYLHETRRKILNAYDNLKKELSRNPTINEVANSTGFSSKKVEEFLLLPDTKSLNEKLSDDTENEIGDFISDDNQNIDAHIEDTILKEEIKELFKKSRLTEREKNVLIWRMGLDGNGVKTLEAIGERLNLTRERIRQIEVKAIKTLRKLKSIKYFAEYMDNPERAKQFIDEFVKTSYQNKRQYKAPKIVISETIQEEAKKEKEKMENNGRKLKLYDLYEYLSDFTEEQIDYEISELSKHDQQIIKDGYNNNIKGRELKKFNDKKEYHTFYEMIKKLKRKLNKRYGIQNPIESNNTTVQTETKESDKPEQKNINQEITDNTYLEILTHPEILKVLYKLPLKELTIVSLKIIFKLNTEDIAELLGLNIGDVITITKQGINLLRNKLNYMINEVELLEKEIGDIPQKNIIK